MEHRIQIPDTDLSLCPIGLGTLSAGLKWDGKEADAIFDAYLELGGNVVDTARIYQDWVPGEVGRSERVVGDWIKRSGKRDQIVLMTKGGHPKYTGPQDDLHLSRMTDADMRRDIELSLKALRTDRIDVYFYHRDNLAQSVAEEIETMERFVREGKIRYYACSNWSADRMREADRVFLREQPARRSGRLYDRTDRHARDRLLRRAVCHADCHLQRDARHAPHGRLLGQPRQLRRQGRRRPGRLAHLDPAEAVRLYLDDRGCGGDAARQRPRHDPLCVCRSARDPALCHHFQLLCLLQAGA